MKMLSIILAVFAVTLLVAHGWVRPIYTMYDECECGRSRAWLEFNEDLCLRSVPIFLRIEKIGDSQHRHQFDDPQYGGQYSVLVYGGIGFLVLSAVVWPYRQKRQS
jgi:hypothetical protein